MNYFKRKREEKEAKRLEVMLELFKMQTVGVHKAVTEGVSDAINIFDDKRYEYEKNVAINIQRIIEDPVLGDKLVNKVADVICEKAEIYSYRITKSKRIELAQDILVALSIKK